MEIFAASFSHSKNLLEDFLSCHRRFQFGHMLKKKRKRRCIGKWNNDCTDNSFSVVTNEPDGNVSLLIYVEKSRSVSFYLSFYFSKNRKNISHVCFMSQLHSKGSADQELQAKSCTQLLGMLSIWDLHQVCLALCAHFVTSTKSEIHCCQSNMLTGGAEGAGWGERGSFLRIRRFESIITPTRSGWWT